jgi:hypothetical protein
MKLANTQELKRGLHCNLADAEQSNIVRKPSYSEPMESKKGTNYYVYLANY